MQTTIFRDIYKRPDETFVYVEYPTPLHEPIQNLGMGKYFRDLVQINALNEMREFGFIPSTTAMSNSGRAYDFNGSPLPIFAIAEQDSNIFYVLSFEHTAAERAKEMFTSAGYKFLDRKEEKLFMRADD